MLVWESWLWQQQPTASSVPSHVETQASKQMPKDTLVTRINTKEHTGTAKNGYPAPGLSPASGDCNTLLYHRHRQTHKCRHTKCNSQHTFSGRVCMSSFLPHCGIWFLLVREQCGSWKLQEIAWQQQQKALWLSLSNNFFQQKSSLLDLFDGKLYVVQRLSQLKVDITRPVILCQWHNSEVVLVCHSCIFTLPLIPPNNPPLPLPTFPSPPPDDAIIITFLLRALIAHNLFIILTTLLCIFLLIFAMLLPFSPSFSPTCVLLLLPSVLFSYLLTFFTHFLLFVTTGHDCFHVLPLSGQAGRSADWQTSRELIDGWGGERGKRKGLCKVCCAVIPLTVFNSNVSPLFLFFYTMFLSR